MSDAGKKLFPEGTNPAKKEDVQKVEEYFQEVSENSDDYILWSPSRKPSQGYVYADSDDDERGDLEREEPPPSLPGTSSQGAASDAGKDRFLLPGEYGWGLPSEIYNQLVRSFGATTLHRVASKLLEEQLMEEDEFGYDEDEGEIVEIEGRTMRSIGSQTEPYLDMCIQTDHDANAEDHVKVGAETRAETEAAVAQERALLQEQINKGEVIPQLKPGVSMVYQQQQQQIQIKQVADGHMAGLESSQQEIIHHPQIEFQSPQEVGMQHNFQQQYDYNIQPFQVTSQQVHQPHPIQHASLQQLQQPQELQAFHQQQSQPPVLKKFWARRESLTAKSESQHHAHIPPEKIGRVTVIEKDREGPPPKGAVAAKKASLEASVPPGIILANVSQKQDAQRQQEKKKSQNVFKLGLKCDIEGQQGFNKMSVEKLAMDKFKTVNYDKTLRNIKSKWVPTPEEEEFIRSLERENELERERVKEIKLKEKERIKQKEKEEKLLEKEEKNKEKEKPKEKEKEKKKKKARSIQVGDPLPQFILNSFRINSPVEIIHATRRRLRRFSSKAESVSGSESSMTPSEIVSPRFSITILDDQGNRDLMVSEAEAYKLSQMGIPFIYKRSSLETPLDIADLDLGQPHGPGGMGAPPFQRSLSAIQASGNLSQLLYNLRAGRLSNPLGASASSLGGRASDRAQRLTQSLLQYLLPAVMQRTRGSGGGGGHASRLVAKRIWRTRSKSQSRASAGTTSIWTPMGNCTWMSVTGRVSTLEPTSLLHLTDLERLSLQRISTAKLQALNLGCQIKIPKEATSTTPNKKKRPYLLKRKALSTGLFETKKEETKGNTGGLVFGLSLTKCMENERLRVREATEREAMPPTGNISGEEGEGSLSRKSSQAGSHASFTSLLDGAKQSTTGSLESLNLERKRPSLGGGEVIVGGSPTSLDLLTVDTQPQVPALVSTCCKFLETHGLHTLGIFRVSSSKKRVRQLREEFDSGKEIILTEDHCPHDIATLLKEFLRDLPDPLLTRELYEPLINTQKIRNRRLQYEAMQYLVQLLPVPNRDTLFSLLNFLTTVAEHANEAESDLLQGNRMDSNNLATLFAPNILHQMKAGSDSLSTSEMTAQAEERIDVINVVRCMIDHNKELFEVSAELLDETYQHLMDTHPEALDILLRRRCAGPDELDLEVDTSSSVFDGSDASSPLPRSPTDHHDFDRLRAGLGIDESEGLKREPPPGHEIPVERTRRRRRHEEEDTRRQYQEKRVSGDSATIEERGWFRRREKSDSREQERGPEHAPERTRWFRRREKTSSTKAPEEKGILRQGSDKTRDKGASRNETPKMRDRIGSQDSIEVQVDKRNQLLMEQEKLKVPEPSVRRLSSPEIDTFGVITASLKIPVPLQQHPASLAFTQETDIPYIEDSNLSEEAKQRLKEAATNGSNSRQRTGSNDSFLGQPITGTMSFQPLSRKEGDKQSHDSVLSSSSMGVYTMSPSERNTPNSDFHYASGASSPMSGAFSPPMWLSPDSGTPGLSPPNSPPPQRRRSRRREESTAKPTPLAHSATHTFGTKPTAPPRTRERTRPQVTPIGRSRTVDALKFDEASEAKRGTQETTRTREETARVRVVSTTPEGEKETTTTATAKRYTRRRYTAERHHTGHLPDISSPPTRASTTESSTQLWKRWEIIASDPTEPETFV